MLRHSQPLHDMAGGGGGGSTADKAKLIFAIVALVIAAVALAWYFGVFGGGGGGGATVDPLDELPEEQRQEVIEQTKEDDLQLQQELDAGRIVESGA